MIHRKAVRALVSLALILTGAAFVVRAEVLKVRPPELLEGSTWTVLEVTGSALPVLADRLESGTFWDLRPVPGAGRLVRFYVARSSHSSGTADRALCTLEEPSGRRIGCRFFRAQDTLATGPRILASDLPGEGATAVEVRSTLRPGDSLAVGDTYQDTAVARGQLVLRAEGTAVAEGVVLVPAGPREAVLVREVRTGPEARALRYRFLDRRGETIALLEGPVPAPGVVFVPERGEVLASSLFADNGIEIRYQDFHQALLPGNTGFLQYSLVADTPLSTMNPAWTSVATMISIDQTAVPYQPDPSDPSSLQTFPEVWDFTGLQPSSLTYRTFNTTRSDNGGGACLSVCATKDTSPSPPDGTWQSYLKIDTYAPAGSFFTRDVFLLNDNDMGANPSIDVPFLAQDESNTEDRTQVCFQQSAGGVNRFLRFFRFTGADPASAVLGVGDTWTSGSWTECDDSHGLRLTAASVCGSSCWPGCSPNPDPRARGMLGGGAGFRMTAIEDGYIKMPTGNYVPSLLLRQDTDLQAGLDFISLCGLGTTRIYSFDYFWVHRKYGLMAAVSAPNDPSATMPPDNWSALGNVTDGADFTWGPFPPYQTEAQACLSGTLMRWSLPADGSNLSSAPGVTDYGYVVSWGALDDPEALADWTTNPNHTPLPGELGYLVAPPGGEPTSTILTSWLGSSIRATVVTALRYSDPDLLDQRTYRSAAFYKVIENPARLSPGTFQVGNGVRPFVTKAGPDLQLAWPAVPGAASYRLRVWNLATRAEIACPPGLNCTPITPSAIHVGGAGGGSYGYSAYAVDPCGGASTN